MKALVINRHWPAYSEEIAREFIGEMATTAAPQALRRAAVAPEARGRNELGAEADQAAAEAEELKAA